MAHPLHEQVRQAFAYRCAYCGVLESDSGGELTVDHYQPRVAGGADELANLVYACHRCNHYKAGYWPTVEEAAAGFILLHPHRHDLSQHYRENELTGTLEPLTATGAFNLRLLHLNRPPLVAHRLARRAAQALEQRVQLLESEAKQSEQAIRILRTYLLLFLQSGSTNPPFDE
ncbi:MAG: HNH endonuclease [Blastocatellia bacterium]